MFGAVWELRPMSISERMHVSEPIRRMEVFTGEGRRRSWSAEEKAAIVAESYAPGETVCGVARRHGLTPPQLFAWRRLARRALTQAEQPTALFVPAVIAAPAPEPVSSRAPRPRRARRQSTSDGIELEIAGVVVRVGAGASEGAITAVIRALKAMP
jgi:transposase